MKLCPIALDDSAETRALLAWLDRSGIQRTDFSAADVVWFMANSGMLPPVEPPDHRCGILCTGSAAQLPQRWGWQPASPEEGTISELVSPQGGTVIAIAARLVSSSAGTSGLPNVPAVLLAALRYCARQQHNTQPVHDATLRPARLPALRAAPGDTTAASGSALHSDTTAVLSAPRVLASAGALHGIRAVWTHPLRIVQAFSVADFAGDHGAVQSNVLQRSDGLLDERVILAHELSAIVWQWAAREARTLRLSWTVDLRMPPPCPAGLSAVSRWNTGDQWLLVQATDSAHSVLFCFDRIVRWDVRALPGAVQVRAETRIDAGAACTLCAILSGPHAAEQETVIRALDQPATLLRSRSAHAARLERDRVSITTPDASANDGWRRAVLQIDAALAELPGLGRAPVVLRTLEGDPYPLVDSSAAVAIALSALTLGDHVLARALIQCLAATQDQNGRIAGECSSAGFCTRADDAATVSFLRLIVRYFDSIGDISYVRSHWPVVRNAVSRAANSLGRSASQALSEVAGAIGEAPDAARWKSAAEAAPVAGIGGPDWTGWNENIDQKAADWLERAGRLAPGDPEAAARLVADLAGGLLGWEPDASRNRVRLRPAIPQAWSTLEVSNLRVGDSRIGLRYRRSSLSHTLVLTPLAGMVPVRVIFEPVIPAPAISQVSVDGKPATLDLQRRAGGWIIPMQVVLDHERTIVVEAAG